MKRFQNKVSLITGGNRGIGRAIALRLASEGSSIILFGRNEKDNQSVEKEISSAYSVPVKSYNVDMSSKKSVEEGIGQAMSHFRRLDVLINNAGICRLSTPFTEITEEDWKETLSVNLYGVIYVTRLVIPYLEKEGGKIINIDSLAGEVGGIATSADYVASKAALQGITKSLARELGGKAYQCQCHSAGLCPHADDGKDEHSAFFHSLKAGGGAGGYCRCCCFSGFRRCQAHYRYYAGCEWRILYELNRL